MVFNYFNIFLGFPSNFKTVRGAIWVFVCDEQCWRRKKTTFQLHSIISSQTTWGTVQVYTGSWCLPINTNGLKSQYSTNHETECFYIITFVCFCLCNFCILKLLFLIIFPDLSSPVLLMNKSFWTKHLLFILLGYLHLTPNIWNFTKA